MPDVLLAPLLSLRDDRESSEGGIDPLGLYTIADSLGVRLVPGVRERQSHPRFLTAIAVSRLLCDGIESEDDEPDSGIPPWLVFEWYLVEGQVRAAAESPDLVKGLPGRLKAQQAQAEGVPLSPQRYLKTPSVFGWHGIYRLLARNLNVEADYGLAEAGRELLRIWEAEQGLNGFLSGTGSGGTERRRLEKAIRNGRQRKATDPKWSNWAFFLNKLGMYAAGTKEKQELWRLLLSDSAGSRRKVLEFLTSAEGARVWRARNDGPSDERPFHAALKAVAGSELKQLLEAISAYERFCRYVQDAFDECLVRLTAAKSKTPVGELADGKAVRSASEHVPELFSEVRERLDPFHRSQQFQNQFQCLAEPLSSLDWLQRLISHHQRTQKEKPPDGKASWFDHYPDGGLILRPLYRERTDQPRHDDSYVHAYRTASLWSFAQDLSMVSP